MPITIGLYVSFGQWDPIMLLTTDPQEAVAAISGNRELAAACVSFWDDLLAVSPMTRKKLIQEQVFYSPSSGTTYTAPALP